MPALAPSAVGESVLRSFHHLLQRDLSTRPVQSVHGMLSECVRAVDPQLSLHVFGSAVVYGFHDPANDVDFVVLRPEDRQRTRTPEDGDDPSASPSASSLGQSTAQRARARPASLAAGGARNSVPAADATSQLAKSLQLDCLGRLEAELRARHESRWDINLVRRARVPVLRARPHDGLALSSTTATTTAAAAVDFDVTAHRRNGVRNSCLLHHYYAQAPHARWLGLAVKRWSKQVGLNGLTAATEAAALTNAAALRGSGAQGAPLTATPASAAHTAGCLTSYAFNLMVVYYLLQRGLVQYVDPEQFLDVSETPAVPEYTPLHAPASTAELGELVLDFARFYRHEFNVASEVVTLSRPTKTTPQELGWTPQAEDRGRMRGEKSNYRLCIEDPYEINLNVGRFVTPFKLMLWQKHIEKAEQTGLLFVNS